jgi:hypothetical protein
MNGHGFANLLFSVITTCVGIRVGVAPEQQIATAKGKGLLGHHLSFSFSADQSAFGERCCNLSHSVAKCLIFGV